MPQNSFLPLRRPSVCPHAPRFAPRSAWRSLYDNGIIEVSPESSFEFREMHVRASRLTALDVTMTEGYAYSVMAE